MMTCATLDGSYLWFIFAHHHSHPIYWVLLSGNSAGDKREVVSELTVLPLRDTGNTAANQPRPSSGAKRGTNSP